MNAQEEDRQKTSCSGRGFGLAAVAVGVGVGAALYYIFNKRPENPHTEGSTSEWNCERSPTFHQLKEDFIDCCDDSYITMSEDETTDTSINQCAANTSLASDDDNNDVGIVITNSDSDVSYHDSDSDASEIDSDSDATEIDSNSSRSDDYNCEVIDLINSTTDLDSDTDLDTEWDVTTSSADVPHVDRLSTFCTLSAIGNLISPIRAITSENSCTTILENGITSSGVNQSTAGASQTSNNVINIDTSDSDKSCSDSDKSYSDSDSDTSDSDTDISTSAVDSDTVLVSDSDVTTSITDILTRFHTNLVTAINNLVGTKPAVTRKTPNERLAILRQQAFRERSWTLEECSICFEVMLRGEEVMALPCTHNFHTHCILPWLQEKQTCPNCRKTAQ